jgi:hypothetical protein
MLLCNQDQWLAGIIARNKRIAQSRLVIEESLAHVDELIRWSLLDALVELEFEIANCLCGLYLKKEVSDLWAANWNILES